MPWDTQACRRQLLIVMALAERRVIHSWQLIHRWAWAPCVYGGVVGPDS